MARPLSSGHEAGADHVTSCCVACSEPAGSGWMMALLGIWATSDTFQGGHVVEDSGYQWVESLALKASVQRGMTSHRGWGPISSGPSSGAPHSCPGCRQPPGNVPCLEVSPQWRIMGRSWSGLGLSHWGGWPGHRLRLDHPNWPPIWGPRGGPRCPRRMMKLWRG